MCIRDSLLTAHAAQTVQIEKGVHLMDADEPHLSLIHISFRVPAWKKTAGIQLISYNIMPGCTTVFTNSFPDSHIIHRKFRQFLRKSCQLFYGMVKFLYYRISSVVLPVRADRQEVKKAMVLSYVKRFLRLYAGLFLCAVSILLAIQGGVGVTPWDVFHLGIQNITGISYGTVNIPVSYTHLDVYKRQIKW